MRLAEADNSASRSLGALRENYRLHRGEGLSALVKTRGKCYLVLTYSLIPCAPSPSDRFTPRSIYIFT